MKCPVCGAECTESSRFCNVCGTALSAKSVETVVVSHKKEKKREKTALNPLKIRLLVRNCVLLILSVLLLVSSFLPIIRVDFAEIEKDAKGLYYDVSPLESVVLMFNNMQNLDNEELLDTLLYEKITELGEDMEDNDAEKYSDLSNREKRAVRKVIKLFARLSMRSEQNRLGVSVMSAGILSVFYILLAVAAFVLCLLNLLAQLFGWKSLFPFATKLTVISAMLLPVLYFCLYLVLAADIGKIGSEKMLKMSAMVIINLCLVGAIAIYLFVERIIVARNTVSLKRSIVNALVITLSIVMLALLFAPTVGVNVNALLENKEKERDVKIDVNTSYFSSFELTEEQIEDMYDSLGKSTDDKIERIESLPGELRYYTATEVKRGEADYLASAMLMTPLVFQYTPTVVKLFSSAPLFCVIFALFASLVLAHSLCFFMLGDKKRYVDIAFSSVMLLCLLLFVAVVIVNVSLVNITLDNCDISKMYMRAYVCAAPITLLVLAVVTFAVVFFDKVRKVVVSSKDEMCDAEAAASADGFEGESAD